MKALTQTKASGEKTGFCKCGCRLQFGMCMRCMALSRILLSVLGGGVPLTLALTVPGLSDFDRFLAGAIGMTFLGSGIAALTYGVWRDVRLSHASARGSAALLPSHSPFVRERRWCLWAAGVLAFFFAIPFLDVFIPSAVGALVALPIHAYLRDRQELEGVEDP